MAGETTAEMTIVIRAQDAASAALKSMAGVVKRVLLAPLDLVWKTATGIFKQFFSLKALLVGGGIFAVLNNMARTLAKSSEAFEPLLSSSTQGRIDAVASAFNRLKASVQSVVAEALGKIKFDEILNGLSDWIRDHKDDVFSFFDKIAENVSFIFNTIKKTVEQANKASGGLPKDARTSNWLSANEDRRANPGLYSEWAPAEEPMGSPRLGTDSRPVDQIQQTTQAVKKHAEIVREAMVASDLLAGSVAKTAAQMREEERATKAAVDIFEDYLTVGEAADTVARTMTDSFFDIIKGTKSVGQAFGEMVGKILEELGRLLIYRSLLNLLVSAGSSLFGGSGSLSIAGSTSSGAITDGFDFPQLARASGGQVSRGGMVRVGENGPENVVLPGGSQVIPSQRSRGGSGMSVNVYGARDAKATALEVAAEIRRNARLRRAFA